MPSTWILQSNPEQFDLHRALETRTVIDWRIPQYTDEVRPGDRALIWRSGKEAGFVGWGIFLGDPKPYDRSRDDESDLRTGLEIREDYLYAPLGVWPAAHIPKDSIAAVLPNHRIVVAPMGTVFPLSTDELAALNPLLGGAGYELDRPSNRSI